ncbi:MAG: hypothetical protein TREMPRED_004613 [Tremellales sp. Tagirdzhanova-0007]|nr:MAG: hypothetical protein TREMPRED_004613 [Tremellales sp. Tagirdzhanova-0007]
MSLDTALATAALLPTIIQSVDQLDFVLAEMDDILGVTSDVRPIVPTVDETNNGFKSARECPSYMKKILPGRAGAVEDLTKQSTVNAKVQSTLAAAIRYTRSDAYLPHLAMGLQGNEQFKGWMRDTLQEMIDEARQDGDLDDSLARKKREIDIEVELGPLGRPFTRPQKLQEGELVVRSALKEWPNTTPLKREMVDVGNGLMEEKWRLDLQQGHVNPMTSDERSLRNSWQNSEKRRGTARGQLLGLDTLVGGQLENNKVQQRQKTLFSAMLDAFEGSILNKCRERRLFRAGLECKIIRMLPLRHHEPHGLRKPGVSDADGHSISFDEFTCYADLWAETKNGTFGVLGQHRDTLAVPSSQASPIYPVRSQHAIIRYHDSYSHLSSPRRQAPNSDFRLPSEHPCSTRSRRPFSRQKVQKANKAVDPAITHGMVDPAIEARLTIRTGRKEHKHLYQAIQKRMDAQPLVEDDVLTKLYWCREGGTSSVKYKQVLLEREGRIAMLDDLGEEENDEDENLDKGEASGQE